MHTLSGLDTDRKLADCAECGLVPVTFVRDARKTAGGTWRCEPRYRAQLRAREAVRPRRDRGMRYPWRKAVEGRLRAMRCERCPFVAEDLCQLDADHIVRQVDGGSDDASNICVLCANCHRLKTKLERLHGLEFSISMWDSFMADLRA